jgi:hypothetical protein
MISNQRAHLKVIVQRDNVSMALGDPLQDVDLVPDLARPRQHGRALGRWRRTMCSRPSMSFLLMTLQA